MRSKSSCPVIDDISAFFISQYSLRMRLNEIGYTDSIENLDCITAEAFSIISNEIENIRSEEAKKRQSKKR